MSKKYIALFVATVFLLGVSTFGLCLDTKPHSLPKHCSDKSSSTTSDPENCFSHCAKQQMVAVKTMSYFGEYSAPFLWDKFSVYLHNHSLLNQNSTATRFYAKHAVSIYINQIYLKVVFNHSPPFSLHTVLFL